MAMSLKPATIFVGCHPTMNRMFSRATPLTSTGVIQPISQLRAPARLILLVLALTIAPAWAQETPDMRPTWFIFLETGKPTPNDKEAVSKMQVGHIQNFKRLFGEKKLFAAGPLSDPSRKKRGIVVVKAGSEAELRTYFQPDDYVREGYMTLNARRSVVHKPLNTEGIDPNGVQEERIVQITRPAKKLTGKQQRANAAFFQGLVDKGTVGAWYTLESGPVAEVLFCRSTDTPALEAVFAEAPSVRAAQASALIWPQWLSKGVVK